MKITELLASDLEALQMGNCWIGYNMEEILKTIDHEMATWKPNRKANSIWQILNHIIFCRNTVAERLINKMLNEDCGDGMVMPVLIDKTNWKTTKCKFKHSYKHLHSAILEFDDRLLLRKLGSATYYGHILGCFQHDAYHFGQIVQLHQQVLNQRKKDEY